MRKIRGASLFEVLVTLAIIGLLLAISLPVFGRIAAASALEEGAQGVRSEFRLWKSRAEAENRFYAIQFRERGGQWQWRVLQDGNGNGVRSAEVTRGSDRVMQDWRSIAAPAAVRVGYARAGMRDVPGSDPATLEGEPVRFGRGEMISFSPIGSCTPGSIYFTDGQRTLCLRLHGLTGRVSWWRAMNPDGAWTLLERGL